jgi:hypothetical protein
MENKTPSVMHSFSDAKNNSVGAGKVLVILIIIAVVGAGVGYLLGQAKNGSPIAGMLPGGSTGNGSSSVSIGKTYGSDDTKTYKDTTEGVLKNGGIDGEGQYHLVRPGGDSQNVYLTSSTVDLSGFLDHKIKVWGQTQAAQKAGWLMDVGRVQVMQ